MSAPANRRILLVDDNASIHADYRKILGAAPAAGAQPSQARAAFFGEAAAAQAAAPGAFEIESAYQGEQGLELARAACTAGKPFALAFVDVRMPPGIDGVQTARSLWEIDPQLQIVICTAFADYGWDEISRTLGRSDRLLILKKPFDPLEVVQLASALSEKWNGAQRERASLEELRRAVQEARSYAASIGMVNRALETAKAGSEARAAAAGHFIERLASVLQESSAALCAALELACEPGGEERARRASLAAASERALEIRNTSRNLALHAGLELQSLVTARVPFSPGELLDGVAARWRERADARGLRLSCEYPGPLPQTVRGDPSLVSNVLEVLVDNALRFTPAGAVRLSVCVPIRNEGEEPQLLYRVTDSGPGIAAPEQPRVFEAFARDAGWAGRGEGAHFSLHMARRLARALGGDLEIESSPGQGTSFRFEVPTGDLAGVEFGLHPQSALPSGEPAPRVC